MDNEEHWKGVLDDWTTDKIRRLTEAREHWVAVAAEYGANQDQRHLTIHSKINNASTSILSLRLAMSKGYHFLAQFILKMGGGHGVEVEEAAAFFQAKKEVEYKQMLWKRFQKLKSMGGAKRRRKNSTRKRRRRTARKKTRQRKPKRTLSKRKKSRGTRRRNR